MAPLGAHEPKNYDGSDLRIGIIHARWNNKIISALLEGVKSTLKARGVKSENIVVQTVPGGYELPYAAQRMYAASQVQSTTSSTAGGLLASATDLLASTSMTDLSKTTAPPPSSTTQVNTSGSTAPFDAIIAIGCLVKGETMHFEYIAEAVSHGLMRAQLDAQVPIVFGLLTVLNEEQGFMRAGIGGQDGKSGHNHGEDWGSAAVELGVKRRGWARGEMVE